jgi:hypothetical protein
VRREDGECGVLALCHMLTRGKEAVSATFQASTVTRGSLCCCCTPAVVTQQQVYEVLVAVLARLPPGTCIQAHACQLVSNICT